MEFVETLLLVFLCLIVIVASVGFSMLIIIVVYKDYLELKERKNKK